MNYKKMLQDGFANTNSYFDIPRTRLEYLADEIFNFTTYDTGRSELFATKAVEVCKAITRKTTYEFIKDESDYQWYLIMCNMPFFVERITWGTSIRGAWWEDSDFRSSGLWNGKDQVVGKLKFDANQWAEFIEAIIEFSKH